MAHQAGNILIVDNNIAFGLIDSGTATKVIIDEKEIKVMTPQGGKRGRGYKIK